MTEFSRFVYPSSWNFESSGNIECAWQYRLLYLPQDLSTPAPYDLVYIIIIVIIIIIIIIIIIREGQIIMAVLILRVEIHKLHGVTNWFTHHSEVNTLTRQSQHTLIY